MLYKFHVHKMVGVSMENYTHCIQQLSNQKLIIFPLYSLICVNIYFLLIIELKVIASGKLERIMVRALAAEWQKCGFESCCRKNIHIWFAAYGDCIGEPRDTNG